MGRGAASMLSFSARCWHLRAKPLLVSQQASLSPHLSPSRLDGNGQRRRGGELAVEELCVYRGGARWPRVRIHTRASLCACRFHFSFPFPLTFARCIEASAWHHGGAASLVCAPFITSP